MLLILALKKLILVNSTQNMFQFDKDDVKDIFGR